MGVATGCGFKEIKLYIFPHTIVYLLLIVYFIIHCIFIINNYCIFIINCI